MTARRSACVFAAAAHRDASQTEAVDINPGFLRGNTARALFSEHFFNQALHCPSSWNGLVQLGGAEKSSK